MNLPLLPRAAGQCPLGLLLALVLPLGAGAQAPTITSTSPTVNTNSAPRGTSVTLTYSQPIAPATAAGVRVFSAQAGGRKASAYATGGNTVVVDPNTDFRPGETVFVTAPATVAGTNGAAAVPRVFQFTTQAGAGGGTFGAATSLAVGPTPYGVAVGDIDNDGDLDMLTANAGGSTVSVRLNQGQGTFGSDPDVGVGSGPVALALGDVDGDGDLDLLTANGSSSSVSVRLNQGGAQGGAAGTFGGGTTLRAGTSSRGLAVGDVDADGDLDLVVTDAGTSQANVYLNNGPGTFGTARGVNVGTAPYGVVLADVDGDGDLDLLTANFGTLGSASTVSVRLNQGAGVFASTGQDVGVGINPAGLAVGDADGDGDLDFVVANSNSNSVSVRLNQGGTFGGSQEVSVGTTPLSVALGDVDGDGDLDLLTANNNNISRNGSVGTVSVRFNQNGLFAGGQEVSVGTAPYGVTLGDLDGDGDLDALAANAGTTASTSTVSVVLNQLPAPAPSGLVTNPARNTNAAPTGTNLTFTYPKPIDPATAAGVRAFSQQAGGRKAASVSASGNTITLDPSTDFRPGETVLVTAPATVRATDGTAAPARVFQFTTQAGAGSGTFAAASSVGVGSQPNAVATGDVDGDGDLDVLTANAGGSTVSVRLNQGAGTYATTGQDVSVGSNPVALALADLDGDGDLDLLVAGSNSVSVRINQGGAQGGSAGTFGSGPTLRAGTNSRGLAVGDLDADGDLDVLVADASSNSVSVYLNSGAAAFGNPRSVSVGTAPNAVAAADVDGDGDLDILATNLGAQSGQSAGTVSVRLNDGSGVFATTGQDVGVGLGPSSLAVGDLDGDADLDFVVTNSRSSISTSANTSTSTVSVRLNQGGTFGGSQEVSVGATPLSVALGDVDGDGDLDLLTANVSNSNVGSVSVRLNQGGTFSGSQDVAVGSQPGGVALGDLDGDGDLDALAANGRSNTVSVLLNQSPAPVLSSLVPGTGPVGSTFSIVGTGLGGTTAITFVPSGGGAATPVPAGYVVASNTSLTGVTVPNGLAGGTYTVAVTTPRGVSNGLPFVVRAAPVANPDAYTTAFNTALSGNVLTNDTGTGLTATALSQPTHGTLTLNSNGSFTYVPTTGYSGPDSFTYQACDTGTPALCSSAATVSLTVQPAACAAPTAVAVGGLTPTSAQITFTGSNAASGYTATYAPSGGATQTVTGSASPLTLNGLVPNTTYVLTVASTCGGQAASAAPISFTTPCETPALAAPADQYVLTDVGQSTASVSFAAAASGQPTPVITYTLNGQPITSPYRFPVGANVVTATAASCGGTASQDFTITVNQRLTSPGPTPTTLAVASTAPAPNALAAPRATTVALTYNQNVDPTTAANVRVFSHQAGGRKAASVSTSSRTITLDPNTDFRPGEVVFVTSPATVRATASSTTTTTPYVYQFTTAAGFGPGTFGSGTSLAAGQLPASVALADVDNDGDLDVLAANATRNGTVSVQLNNGQGSFTSAGSLPVGAYPAHLTTADLNGDGNLDLLVANAGSNTVSVRLSNGRGGLAGGQEVPVGQYPMSVAAADLDADGDLDLLAANLGSDNVSVRFNNGQGAFSGTTSVAVGPNTSSVEAADVDGDGDLDLLMANAGSSGTVSVRLNDGQGVFSGTGSVAVGAYPTHVTAADMDADGDLDLLTANATQSGTVSVRLNNGQGAFSGTTSLAVGRYPASVEAADVDGDGDLDLLVANAGSNTVSVRLNNGLGSFSGSQEVAVGSAPLRVAAADLDGDGDLDLATVDANGNTVSVRLNQNPAATTSSAARTGALAATPTPGASTDPLYPLVDGTLFPQFLAAGPRAAAEPAVVPAEFSTYPNPVMRTATVRLTATQASQQVQLRVYNTLGQVVATLYEGPLAAGELLERPLDATGLAAGVYTCRLTGAGPARSLKLVVNP